MRNPKFCKPFLERILNIKISRIEYPKSQETIDISADAKSGRLDIYVEDGKETVYNIEIKNEKWRLDYMTLQMNYQEKYEQGIEHEKMDLAIRMIEDGDLPLEKVAMYSGLTLEEVIELEREL